MSNSSKVTEYRRRRKQNLIWVLGNKCCLCGYNKLQDALEFHHIDPQQKLYAIANGGTCHDLEKDLAEIKKCILVCANCHRQIHKNFYTKEKLWEKQFYDTIKADALREEKKALSTKTHNFCLICGKEISNNTVTSLCSQCYAQTVRKIERPDRNTLKQLIRTVPFTQIGKMFNITDNSVRKWCDKYNLPRTKKEILSYSDDQWEKI